jgi:hypothetical protein
MILRKFMLVGPEIGIDGRPRQVEKQLLMEDRHATAQWRARFLNTMNAKEKSINQGENLGAIGKREGIDVTELGGYTLVDMGLVDNFGKPIIEEVSKPKRSKKTETLEFYDETTTETV